MKLVLFDRSQNLCDAWEKEFGDEVTIQNIDVDVMVKQKPDVIICPGNCFGIMDSGVERKIAEEFDDIQEWVTLNVKQNWYGQQPIGTSTLSYGSKTNTTLIAYTPIMRFPKNIAPEFVYDGMRAAIMEIRQYNALMEGARNFDGVIKTVACPGLGTLTGGISAREAARLMSSAWYDTAEGDKSVDNWQDAEPILNGIYR